MTVKTPNEKVCEELFIAYGLQYVLPKRLILYAPTLSEEKELGYDAALFSGNLRELVLQFKRADKVSKDSISFKVNQYQLTKLKAYPRHSAFYVIGLFPELIHLFSSQAHDVPQVFLNQYIAIPVEEIVTKMINPYEQVTFELEKTFISGFINIGRNRSNYYKGSDLFNAFMHPNNFSVGLSIVVDKVTNQVRLESNPAQVERGNNQVINNAQSWIGDILADFPENDQPVFLRYYPGNV